MKICITAEGDHLGSVVDQRFGRSRYFIIVDTDTLEFEAVQNPNASSTGGVGVQSGQLLAQKGVQCVLTGRVGPNASQTLQAAAIEVIVDVSGTVKEVIDKFQGGELPVKQA